MSILRIEHPVPDYAAWKEAFDADPVGRERSGGPCSRRSGHALGRPSTATSPRS